MAAGSSEAASASREFREDDLGDLCDALHKVSTKYTFFGLKIGLKMHEVRRIAEMHSDSAHCLLEILSARLNQESALTCADIVKALKSTSVSEHYLATEFQKQFENMIHEGQTEKEKVSSKKKKAAKSTECGIPKMAQSKSIEDVEIEDESMSDESENIQKAKKSAEVERQVERDEPKSKIAKKRARKKERMAKNQRTDEQPASESAIQLRISKKENEDELKSYESENIQKAVKSAEVERQVHERDESKSKRAKKRAHNREKNRCASEQLEPDEYKENERKEMKAKQKQKMHFSEMAASPQSGAECDQKRKKSVKESEKIAPEMMSTDSENESSDACKKKEILSTKSERTGKVRECAAYSEFKHQPQSAKIREVKNEAKKKEKIPEKEGSTKKQHSVLHRKTAVAVESDEDTSEPPSHKSQNKLEAEETESEESFSESTSNESETESFKHKEKVKPKSPTDTEEIYHGSDEEMKKVKAKKMPQKFKVATAKSSPHSERLAEEEQLKQKKGKGCVDRKYQERESELRAKASRGKPHSQVKERGRVKETNSVMKAKRLVAHSSKQTSDESETNSENEASDSENDGSEDEEGSEGKSSDEKEKTETDEESSTAPSEEELMKMKKKEKSVSHEREKAKREGFEEERKKAVNKAAIEQSKYYDSMQRGREFDEIHTRKEKGKRESESASLIYDSPGDDEQSDPGCGSRDQEEHDIQQKRRKKKKERRESSMSPTAIGSSSPSTSQEEKKQPVSKKQGHRKKHVRKMKEKRERMKRGKEKAARSSGIGDSSLECDMTKNQYESEMKKLINIFKQFFGQLCCVEFRPEDIAAQLQKKGLISRATMREMMLSPESQQVKIIALIDKLDKKTKSHPDCLFMIIEVMLENEVLCETAKEILREAGTQCVACTLHFVLDIKTLFPAGRVCPVETAAKFPSQIPRSDAVVPLTADTFPLTAIGK